MKNFRSQIKHVCNDNFTSITTCINWKLIVDEDFSAFHFCGTIEADLAIPNFGHFLAYLELAPIVPQKCYAPKSTSTSSFQLIQMVSDGKMWIET